MSDTPRIEVTVDDDAAPLDAEQLDRALAELLAQETPRPATPEGPPRPKLHRPEEGGES
jgi:hypothetical protein